MHSQVGIHLRTSFYVHYTDVSMYFINKDMPLYLVSGKIILEAAQLQN